MSSHSLCIVFTLQVVIPFLLNYGHHPWKGFEPRGRVKTESATEFTTRTKTIADDANSALVKAAATMKHFYYQKHQDAPDYKSRDLVWLEATNIRSTQPSKKLDDRRLGPLNISRD